MDPKLSASESPYSAMGCNPVLFTDVLGDSAFVNDLYEKNKDGGYKHPNQIEAFERWISTENGNEFLKDRAQAGFYLEFQFFNKGKVIRFEKEGKLSKKGIDIEFRVDNLQDHFIKYHGGKLAAQAHFDSWDYQNSFGNTRLWEKATLPEDINNKRNTYNIFHYIENWMHEFQYHGYLHEKYFLQNKRDCGLTPHNWNLFLSTPYAKYATKSLLGIKTDLGLTYTTEHIIFRIQLSGFGFRALQKDRKLIIDKLTK